MNDKSANAPSHHANHPVPGPGLFIQESAIQGMGVFAEKNFRKGTRVIEYVGERIDKTDSGRRCAENNPFIFYLDEEWDLDGNAPWNPARLINHSCDPNCEAQYLEGRVWITARRSIKKGEEITFNYGYDLEDFKDYPCRCGAANCVGYIVAEEHFSEIQEKSKAELL
jgi:uncharacterized protein